MLVHYKWWKHLLVFKVIKPGRKLLSFKNTNGIILVVRGKLTELLVTEESMQQQVLSGEMQL